MHDLQRLQRQLAAEILGHAAAAPPPDDGLRAALRLPGGVDAESRLAVYRDGYPARIRDALRDVYPAIANICGDGDFARLVQRTLRARDLSRRALNDVGRELAPYLEDDPLAAALPFLPDLARLEWQVLRSFHSHDRSPLDAARFAAFDMDDWERVVLGFQPSAALLRSAWPILDLWETRDTPRAEIDVDLADRPQTVLVLRAGDDVACRLAGAAEGAVFDALRSGAPLGRAMEMLAELDDGDGADPGAMFSTWIAAGLVVSADLAGP